jgi:uncharacterized protein (TIGR02996 family)
LTSNELESDLLAAVLASSDDDHARLVYADWLEERGDIRADYLRLESELVSLSESNSRYGSLKEELQKLAGEIDLAWRLRITQSRIENCDVPSAPDGLFAFECPRSWHRLQETESSGVRLCAGCQQHVFLCSSTEEASSVGSTGACVAIDACAKPARNVNGPRDRDTLQLQPIRLGKVVPLRPSKDMLQKLVRFPSQRVTLRSQDRKS